MRTLIVDSLEDVTSEEREQYDEVITERDFEIRLFFLWSLVCGFILIISCYM